MNLSMIHVRKLLVTMGLFFPFICSTHAADVEPLKTTLMPPASPWQFEFGPRYWYSSARYKENLMGNSASTIVSRLTYEDLSANSAEAFGRLEHQSGIYIKGYVGGGSIDGGQLVDEDFPPGISPYSKTVSPQHHGSLGYLSADLGYNFFTSTTSRLGGFIGYHYWQEQVDNFGCTQVANGPVCVSPIATSVNVLNNSAAWNSLRLGVNGDVHVRDAWHLETDLAYIHSSLSENDFHNLRPDIRGVLDTGTGNGFQLDMMLKWLLTEELSVGMGGRWWYLSTDGLAHFEQVDNAGQPQVLDGIQSRYGLLVQANYRFLDDVHVSKGNPTALEFNWEGVYLGANLGYGTSPSLVSMAPSSGITQNLQANAYAPYSLNLQNAGFLSGGQLGYNWHVKHLVLGLEGDIDYAQIGGANAATSSLPLTTTVSQNIRWLSSLRGRLGKLASPTMLAYVTAGPAWGGTTLAFDQRNVGTSCASSSVCLVATDSSTQTGWTAGGGIEYAATPRMTLKAEYLYVDLGSPRMLASSTSVLGQTSYLVSTSAHANTMRLGLNYKIA